MALIIMAVYDTEQNGRTRFTYETLYGTGPRAGVACLGLMDSVDWMHTNSRMIIVDNDSCEATKTLLRKFADQVNWYAYPDGGEERVKIITLPANVGTARAVNKGLALRKPGEYCIKMDNDVVIDRRGWVEKMEEVMRRMPQIGVLGLKRRDLLESPYAINTDQRSRLMEVPHQPGEPWYVVEECKHVMGTCTMLSPELLDKVGYFYQCQGLYGFDDSLMCVRCTKVGLYNCFLHGIDIDHVDPGGTAYTEWKAKAAGEMLLKYAEEEAAIKNGVRSPYYGDI